MNHRRWRGEFLSYTPLWTSFALKPASSTFSTAYLVEMKRRAIVYLERSGQQPLTIFASIPCPGTGNFPNMIWEMLLSCLKRWRKADLVLLGHGAALDKLLRYGSSLESLRISITNFTPSLDNLNASLVAPRLTELDLTTYTASWQFPWAQLMKLKIHTFGAESQGVLFQLENIEELHISGGFYPCRPESPLLIKRLPGLRLLEIPLSFAPIFSRFTAPLLEHICILNGYVFYPNPEPYARELASLIQSSSCHIRRLEFVNRSSETMWVVLKALPSIEEFSMNYQSNPSIIREINITPGPDGCIYPQVYINGSVLERLTPSLDEGYE